jgi:transcription factor SFP1
MNDIPDTQTPPPLHYSPSLSDHDHPSTRESTPISTPVGFGATSYARKTSSRGKDFLSWSSQKTEAGSRPLHLDSTLIEADNDSCNFSFFPSSPADTGTMSGQAAPIDIATRQTSVSPPGQQASNLTSALQRAASNDRAGSISAATGASSSAAFKAAAARKDSLSASMAQWGNGTKPISVMGSNRDKPRRESLAGSLVGGMSWGGVSVGSWIRDEFVNPFSPHRSYFASIFCAELADTNT